MKRPAWFTKKQMELLIKITPPPIGEGKSVKEASKELGICYRASMARIAAFKKRFPKEYRNWLWIRAIWKKHKRDLHSWSFNRQNRIVLVDLDSIHEDIVKEKF